MVSLLGLLFLFYSHDLQVSHGAVHVGLPVVFHTMATMLLSTSGNRGAHLLTATGDTPTQRHVLEVGETDLQTVCQAQGTLRLPSRSGDRYNFLTEIGLGFSHAIGVTWDS